MVDVTLFTDPACPFAFSAEPARLRLRWHWGDGLRWTVRMIVLTRERGEADNLATPFDGLQRKHGMPIKTGPAERAASSEPACRLVVAARLHEAGAERSAEPLLRALRVRSMAGGLLDDPALLDAALTDAGLDPQRLHRLAEGDDVALALEADADAARDPLPAARALDHKLGGPAEHRRYSAPSYELRGNGAVLAIPGFNPFETYDAAVANADPTLTRRPAPGSVAELLDWAEMPLATAEVVAITGRGEAAVRDELARVAECLPAGADAYWRAR